MLPFKNRLVKKKDFEKVSQNGQFCAEGCVAAKIIDNGKKEARLGFVVGVKFSPKATERNTVKRQLREIFRKKIAAIKPGRDIIVMARKRKAEKIKFNKLRDDAEKLLKKWLV